MITIDTPDGCWEFVPGRDLSEYHAPGLAVLERRPDRRESAGADPACDRGALSLSAGRRKSEDDDDYEEVDFDFEDDDDDDPPDDDSEEFDDDDDDDDDVDDDLDDFGDDD